METMIVLLLLGIVTMLGLPSLNGALDDSRLSGAAGEVVTTLEFAQMTAMSSGRQTRVNIDDAADTILVEQFTSNADFNQSQVNQADVEGGEFAPMWDPLNRGAAYSISLSSEDRFKGVDITLAAFGGANWVIFGEWGVPSSGGTVTLACGNSQAVVSLDSLTGKVSVSN